MNTKKCNKCNKTLPLDQFAKRSAAKDGYRNECKKCHNQYFREYFDNKENMAKQVNRVDKNKKQYRWKFKQYKLSKGCAICGYKKCAAALSFHHLNGELKKINLSKATRHSFSQEKINEELKNCILLCANCHMEIHYGDTVLPLEYTKYME